MFQVDQSNLISLYCHLQRKQYRSLPRLQYLRGIVDGIIVSPKSKHSSEDTPSNMVLTKISLQELLTASPATINTVRINPQPLVVCSSIFYQPGETPKLGKVG